MPISVKKGLKSEIGQIKCLTIQPSLLSHSMKYERSYLQASAKMQQIAGIQQNSEAITGCIATSRDGTLASCAPSVTFCTYL